MVADRATTPPPFAGFHGDLRRPGGNGTLWDGLLNGKVTLEREKLDGDAEAGLCVHEGTFHVEWLGRGGKRFGISGCRV